MLIVGISGSVDVLPSRRSAALRRSPCALGGAAPSERGLDRVFLSRYRVDSLYSHTLYHKRCLFATEKYFLFCTPKGPTRIDGSRLHEYNKDAPQEERR